MNLWEFSQVVQQEDDGESVYANRQVTSESLHYSSVMFTKRAGSEMKGFSSLTDEYATVQHSSKQQNKGGNVGQERDKEELKHSDGAEVFYAQVKTRKPE